jgi:hypothetical protein
MIGFMTTTVHRDLLISSGPADRTGKVAEPT